MKIFIDPGHGGKDSGACGGTYTESEMVLGIGMELADRLQSEGYIVDISRDEDVFVELRDRCRFANEFEADIFISVHCNGAENKSANGFEIFTSNGETGADLLAHKIALVWKDTFPYLRFRGEKEAGFYVLRHTAMPAVLIELGFITNEDDEAFLATHQDEIIDAIIEGVKAFEADSY